MKLYIIRLLYLPTFLLLGNGLAYFVLVSGYSSIWLFFLAAVFVSLAFIAESFVPYSADFNKPQGDRLRDFIHAFVNEGMVVAGVLVLPIISVYLPVLAGWPLNWPLWGQLLLAILVADVGITLTHFFSHKVKFLWRFHAVHHSVKRMYGFNGLMKHPLHQVLETAMGIAPLLLMGVPQEVISLLGIAVVLQLLVQHSNVNYFTGPLKSILAVNVIHRFHHLNSKAGDVNFGLFTSLTDRVLGSYYYDEQRSITGADLGISSAPDYPVGYIPQLLQPFKPQQ